MKTKITSDFEIGQIVRHRASGRKGIILMVCDADHWRNDPHFYVEFGEYKGCVLPENLEPVRIVERYVIDLWTRPSFVPASS